MHRLKNIPCFLGCGVTLNSSILIRSNYFDDGIKTFFVTSRFFTPFLCPLDNFPSKTRYGPLVTRTRSVSKTFNKHSGSLPSLESTRKKCVFVEISLYKIKNRAVKPNKVNLL